MSLNCLMDKIYKLLRLCIYNMSMETCVFLLITYNVRNYSNRLDFIHESITSFWHTP